MPKSRLDLLALAAEKDPKNAFARYGLAMELARLGRLEEAAEAFCALAADLPDYVPTYFQAGKTFERLGRADNARDMYERGIAAAARAGNAHARDELEAALRMVS
jgi:tetratricopeptide (TPR) repeat protein